jgi:hypothetical protein
MQKKISLPILLTALVGLAISCAQNSDSYPVSAGQSASSQSTDASASPMEESAPAAYDGASETGKSTPVQQKTIHDGFISSSAAAVSTDTSKKFIRTADMRFRVADARQGTLRVEAITKYFDGWVTSSSLVSNTNRVELTPISADSSLEQTFYTVTSDLTLRVPQANLDTTIKCIARLITYLDYRTIGAEDIELKALAESLKQKRNLEHDRRLREAVDNQDAKLSSIADVELARLNAQINADQALLNKLTLQDKVAYSVVNVRLYQREAVQAEVIANHKNVDAYRPGFFSRMGSSLAAGWRHLLDFLIELMLAWPALLILSIAGVVVYRKFFRKKA